MDGTQSTLTTATNSTGASPVPHPSAIIVAGAAAKGPYAASALAVIAEDPRFDVRCLVGASSGALNAAVFAAGLRVGAALEAATHLSALWRDQAWWYRILSHRQRVNIVSSALKRFQHRNPVRDVALEVVVTSLQGKKEPRFGYLRYEAVHHFGQADFASDEGVARIAESCILSATIPGLFPPRRSGGEQFWDGGVVNNTPIGLALKRDPLVNHLIVVTPDVGSPSSQSFSRFSLSRLLQILIEERLSRDLVEAKSFNEELLKLEERGVDLQSLRPALHWRVLRFVEVRPNAPLRGDLLRGFLSKKARAEYLKAGTETAERTLREWQEFSISPSVRDD